MSCSRSFDHCAGLFPASSIRLGRRLMDAGHREETVHFAIIGDRPNAAVLATAYRNKREPFISCHSQPLFGRTGMIPPMPPLRRALAFSTAGPAWVGGCAAGYLPGRVTGRAFCQKRTSFAQLELARVDPKRTSVKMHRPWLDPCRWNW